MQTIQLKHQKIGIYRLFAFCLAITLLWAGCTRDAVQDLPERQWQLVWSDDFDGAAGSAPDAANWTYDIGRGDNGWGNQELQYYTNRRENVAKDGSGNLVITARAETFAGSPYTSARIKTQGLFSQAYGRIEARIKTPFGPGIWPAFWMLGDNITTEGWPLCGEIDIMEQRGQEPHIANGTIHGPGYSGGAAITKSFTFTDQRFDQNFHVFAAEWFEDRIDLFVDDYLYHRITRSSIEAKGQWVFDKPFFLLLNVAVGGTYVGFPTTGTPFPQRMTIDYVRVYKGIE